MILGTQATVSIAFTFAVALQQYRRTFEGKNNYKELPLKRKIAGFITETAIFFCTYYLIFSINLAGRVSSFRKIPLPLQLLAEIIQPMAQFHFSQKAAANLTTAFRTRFILPKPCQKPKE